MATSISAIVPFSWFLFAMVSAQGIVDIPSSCIQCLCEAVSGPLSCVPGHFGSCQDGVCGLYSITRPYWEHAGELTVGLNDQNSKNAFENCALDPTCSVATIRSYMVRFQQDCNNDGKVDCHDFTAIHFHGGYSCNRSLSESVTTGLNKCLGASPGQSNITPTPIPVDFKLGG
uniref:lysozyme n=1 Tax=Graphocephala atropunctata TaxID=36148 RepID=A0A1B6M6F3_9HEMI